MESAFSEFTFESIFMAILSTPEGWQLIPRGMTILPIFGQHVIFPATPLPLIGWSIDHLRASGSHKIERTMSF